MLLVPRYAADWLLGFTPAPALPTPPAQTASAPDDHVVAETAAMLWDPDCGGPMASLACALQAARAVVLEAESLKV